MLTWGLVSFFCLCGCSYFNGCDGVGAFCNGPQCSAQNVTVRCDDDDVSGWACSEIPCMCTDEVSVYAGRAGGHVLRLNPERVDAIEDGTKTLDQG